MEKEQEWLPIGKFDAIRVSEYNGKFSVQKGRIGKEKTTPAWAIATQWDDSLKKFVPKQKDDGGYLYLPVQIPLGDCQAQAIDAIKQLYFQVAGKPIDVDADEEQPQRPYDGPPEPPVEEAVPF